MSKEANVKDGQNELDVPEMSRTVDSIESTGFTKCFLFGCSLHRLQSDKSCTATIFAH
jgi:hypothetical protein